MNLLLLFLCVLGVNSQFLHISTLNERIRNLREAKQTDVNPLLFESLQAHRLISAIQIEGVNVSLECAQDLGMFVSSASTLFHEIEGRLMDSSVNVTLTDFDRQVLLPALDAAGKPGAGILRGHIKWNGELRECRNIDYTPEGRSRKYGVDFNRLYIDGSLRANTEEGACAVGTGFGLDLCLPSACTTDEYSDIFKNMNVTALGGGSPICKFVNINSGLQEGDAGTWIVYSIMGVILATCVLAGAVDFFISDLVKGASFTRGLGWQLFMAFSFYRNISEIFSVGGAKKAGQIGPIHCIRFFSLCWVIAGHCMYVSLYYISNPLDLVEDTRNTAMEFLTNAFFSVDTFFFLSGLLLAFIWFKMYNKNRKATTSPLSWVMFYVHRILRLSPAYYITIVFWTFVFQTWLKNMPQIMAIDMESPTCKENWWINFLFLNNYVRHKEQCYPVSWYLAADMQIFLFTPIILVPLASSAVVGTIVALVVFALSTAANIVQVYHFYFPPTIIVDGWVDPRQTETDYSLYMYDSPYIRCQPYIIGILVGYLLQNKKTMRINHILNIVLWVLSFTVMLTVVLGMHSIANGNELSLFWRAMYSAFSKPAWTLGLTWIVVSCYYGYGGPFNSFMSWNIWVPLGRLSYCAYLTHWCVITYLIGLNDGEMFYSNFADFAANIILPAIMITYFFSVIWSAAFELSLGKVEMLLLGGFRGKGPEKKKQEESN